ncbi:uncharacterized protein KY384_002260 [Bacidia gigantensis]|uniref:uncharacterized protein n=1 Tax=Bacidia gigantensis TaxID=2732470 RepID=UPI001D040A21|nr:uncharacterized protein KY384_002260 [Bacidia gigantensis]KAG8533477.1 hypothetical protein KY384_002260 [Bacidia gigantensis]
MTFLTEAWFWRGTQSALFYYVSCAPYTKYAERRKKKTEAKGAREERKENEKLGIFQHPLPSERNPGWNEEIRVGPGPPPNRMTKAEKKKRRLLKLKPPGARDIESAGDSSTATGVTSVGPGDEAATSQDISRSSEEGWNRRRYQREDELLWGRMDEDLASSNSFSRVSSSARGSGTYYCARNPEVNELHPPVVSTQPTSKAEIQWMLQPPPKAKVMAGKERENRSRSGSGTSHGSSVGSRASSRRGGENLGRRIGEKIMEEKMAKDGHLHPTMASNSMSRINTSRSTLSFTSASTSKAGQNHDRDLSRDKASIDSLEMSQLNGNASYFPAYPPDHFLAPNAAARPQLPSIPSASRDGTSLIPRPRPALLSTASDSSLRTLQALMPNSPLVNSQGSHGIGPSLEIARSIGLPLSPREKHDQEDILQVENWQPELDPSDRWSLPIPNIALPLKQRWSMET